MSAVSGTGPPGTAASERRIWSLLAGVEDPEIPVLSVLDLGIVRAVRCGENGVTIDVTPTYSGCPATEAIENGILAALESAGFDNVRVRRVLSPPWTTDWLSAEGRDKLRAYGIAPPAGAAPKGTLMPPARPVACPRCGATDTERVSEFGSTACKAAYRCGACLEPFEYFKCL